MEMIWPHFNWCTYYNEPSMKLIYARRYTRIITLYAESQSTRSDFRAQDALVIGQSVVGRRFLLKYSSDSQEQQEGKEGRKSLEVRAQDQ